VEGSVDRGLLSLFFLFFDLSGIPNPFNDPTVVVAALPGGKGDAVHLSMFHRLLKETFHLKTKVACILDSDYDFGDSGAIVKGDVLTLSLPRKEIENYFVCPEVLARAAKDLAENRCRRTGQNLPTPTVEEWPARIDEILAGREIRSSDCGSLG